MPDQALHWSEAAAALRGGVRRSVPAARRQPAARSPRGLPRRRDEDRRRPRLRRRAAAAVARGPLRAGDRRRFRRRACSTAPASAARGWRTSNSCSATWPTSRRWPGMVDVAVAVNSLVQPSVGALEAVLRQVHAALRPGGVFLGIVPAMDAVHYQTMLLVDRARETRHARGGRPARTPPSHAEHAPVRLRLRRLPLCRPRTALLAAVRGPPTACGAPASAASAGPRCGSTRRSSPAPAT